MNHRLSLLACCCVAFVVVVTTPAYALPGEVEPKVCSYICTPGEDPCTSCRNSFGYITCGQFWGHPANDLDGDGVVDTNDNCRCTANASQANCDGDAYGDACDFEADWTLISVGTSACDVQEEDEWDGTEVRIYYQDKYRNACTGAICFDKYRRYNLECTWGADEYQCCRQQRCGNTFFPCPDCDVAWVDNCGYPRCPWSY